MKSYINLHHFKRYKRFIQTRRPSSGYTESHHIIPKSIIKNDSMISLTAREHYIAHKILSKVFVENTPFWFSMAKAFNRMFSISESHIEKYINSRDYEYRKQLHSDSMKYKNPMHDLETVEKASIAMKASWTTERRLTHSNFRIGNDNISQAGKDRLSRLWAGVPRPKKEGQVAKNIKASSVGLFITPFGSFDSPGQASRSPKNKNNLSRYLIVKHCNDDLVTDFRFISNGRKETRGLWKRKT